MAISSEQEIKGPAQRIFQTIGLALLFAIPSFCATTVAFELALAQPATRTIVADISSRLFPDYSAQEGVAASRLPLGNSKALQQEVSKEEEQQQMQEQQPTPSVVIIESQATPTFTPVPGSTPQPTNTPSGQQRNPTPTPTKTPQPTNTPRPTNTPAATNTPLPTNTPVPTSTPVPTNTPVPTDTPLPTDTPTPTPIVTVPSTDTIHITSAEWSTNQRLVVEGTGSQNGCTVNLVGSGESAQVKGGKFKLMKNGVPVAPPSVVVVSDCGGSDTHDVTVKP